MIVCLFFGLYSILFYEFIKVYLFFLLLLGMWVIFIFFWLLWVMYLCGGFNEDRNILGKLKKVFNLSVVGLF